MIKNQNTANTNTRRNFLAEAIEPTKDEYESAMAEYELGEYEYIAMMKYEEEELLNTLYDLMDITSISKDVAA